MSAHLPLRNISSIDLKRVSLLAGSSRVRQVMALGDGLSRRIPPQTVDLQNKVRALPCALRTGYLSETRIQTDSFLARPWEQLHDKVLRVYALQQSEPE